MNNIIERRPAYSNDAMIEYCTTLLNVLTLKVEVTVGRGRSATKEQVYKHNPKQELIDKIRNSIEYYQELNQIDMSKTIKLRDYQENISKLGCDIINKYGFVYLAMEVRTGKTLTSLDICDNLENVDNVLFLTKKKAISSITEDSDKLCPSYALFVINYESIHKIPNIKWDVIICDEAHTMGAFPKPNGRAKSVKQLIASTGARVILMSGTPTPESYSQMYHQVYGIRNNPFRHYKNFYRFGDDYIKLKQKKINGMMINDYKNGKTTIIDAMNPYTINYSQKQAGFSVTINETILHIDIDDKVKSIIKKLSRDLVVEGKDEVILADTPVKLMQKLHQLYSGTIKFESGNSMIIDTSKAEFIKSKFKGKKIGIFYKFKEELNAIKQVFGDDVTTEISVFKDTDCKVIALQIVSGREGISLRQAEALGYYNIDFSATSYWQSRDRMTTIDRQHNNVYWVFSRGGIEDKIYKAVTKKKDYTLKHFKGDYIE